MTRDEFVDYWTANAGIALEKLKASGHIALPCDCGECSCKGWQMTNAILYQLDSEALLALSQEYQDEIKLLEGR